MPPNMDAVRCFFQRISVFFNNAQVWFHETGMHFSCYADMNEHMFTTFPFGGWEVTECRKTAGNVFHGSYGTDVDGFMLQQLPQLPTAFGSGLFDAQNCAS